MPRKTKANPLVSGRAEPYLYLLPTIVLFVFILAVPLFNLFKYSLGDSNIIQGFKEWNSFENFKYLGSPKFLSSVWVTVIYVFFGVLGVVLCGTIVSLALDKPIPGGGLFAPSPSSLGSYRRPLRRRCGAGWSMPNSASSISFSGPWG